MKNSLYIQCNSILNFFNRIPFGVYADEKLYTDNELTDEIFWQKWKLLSPIQVVSFNAGICWDISFSIKNYLDKLNIENYEIYCQMDNKQQSAHSFNVIFDNEKNIYYILDGAWKRFNTLTICKTIKKVCQIMSQRMFDQHNEGDYIEFYYLGEFRPIPNMNCQQYMQNAHKNKMIFQFNRKSK